MDYMKCQLARAPYDWPVQPAKRNNAKQLSFLVTMEYNVQPKDCNVCRAVRIQVNVGLNIMLSTVINAWKRQKINGRIQCKKKECLMLALFLLWIRIFVCCYITI